MNQPRELPVVCPRCLAITAVRMTKDSKFTDFIPEQHDDVLDCARGLPPRITALAQEIQRLIELHRKLTKIILPEVERLMHLAHPGLSQGIPADAVVSKAGLLIPRATAKPPIPGGLDADSKKFKIARG